MPGSRAPTTDEMAKVRRSIESKPIGQWRVFSRKPVFADLPGAGDSNAHGDSTRRHAYSALLVLVQEAEAQHGFHVAEYDQLADFNPSAKQCQSNKEGMVWWMASTTGRTVAQAHVPERRHALQLSADLEVPVLHRCPC